MINRIAASLILGLILCFFSCVRGKRSGPLTEEEAIQVIRSFDEGWEHKNFKLVDSVLAPNYVYFTQSGGLFSRDSLVQTAGSPVYTLSRVHRSAFEVKLQGNVGVVSTRWEGTGVYRGIPFHEDQRCSITVVKIKGKTMILSEHCTPIKPLFLLH